jgi:hypothetical protein
MVIISKADLKHGEYYYGSCRNASVARWNDETERFVYWRHKFGDRFAEEINHPEDDDGFDLFWPQYVVTWDDDEIPLNA